jgi:phosphate/sulfate permease
MTVPSWAENSVLLIILACVILPLFGGVVAIVLRKLKHEDTLAKQLLTQLAERDSALASERASNAQEQREQREAHAQEQRQMREAHAIEMKTERENSKALSDRVMDLTSRLVQQASDSAQRLTAVVEQVRSESREGIKRLHDKLDASEATTKDCERRHAERDRIEAERRAEEDRRNAERDGKMDALLALLAKNGIPTS